MTGIYVNALWPSDAICCQEIWVSIGLGNDLLPDGTKPLPEPMSTDHRWSAVTFILGQFHMRLPQPSITKICLKITCLKFHSNFPRANELMNDGGDFGVSSSINCFLPVFITFYTHHLLVPFQKNVGWWCVCAVNMMVKIYPSVSPAIYVLHINEKKISWRNHCYWLDGHHLIYAYTLCWLLLIPHVVGKWHLAGSNKNEP